MRATDLLGTAEKLLEGGRGAPRQANLRKAISALYYALFHALCANCAGTLARWETRRAWTQVYRAVEHRAARDSCGRLHGMGFPAEIEHFAKLFVQLQEKRHRADYDPNGRFYKSEIETDIEAAAAAVVALRTSALRHRRALAAHILIRAARL